MTDLYLRPGIGSQDLLVMRCLKTWLPSINVVRMRQVGSTEVIPQWLMELSNAKSVSIGPLTTAVGLPTSVFATVVLSLCTSCLQRVTAICDTVGTGVQVQNDLNSVDFHVGKNHSANVIVSCLTCFHCLLLTDFGCFLRHDKIHATLKSRTPADVLPLNGKTSAGGLIFSSTYPLHRASLCGMKGVKNQIVEIPICQWHDEFDESLEKRQAFGLIIYTRVLTRHSQ